MFKDYYLILEIKHTATLLEIKKSYRKLALIHHPDKTFNNKTSGIKFLEVQEAYEILSDSVKREIYDLKYKNHYKLGSQNQSKHNGKKDDKSPPYTDPTTNLTYLKLFNDIKNKVVGIDKKNINQKNLHDTLNNLLSDENINFIRKFDDLNVNRQIVDLILICCKKLDFEYIEKLSLKLVKLSGYDNNTIKVIYDFTKKRRVSGQYQKYNRKAFYYLDNYVTPNKRYVFWLVILTVIIASVINSKNNDTSNRPVSGNIYSNSDSATNAIKNDPNTIIDSSERTVASINSDSSNWNQTSYTTGNSPSCFNYHPKYNLSLNNKLEISVGSNTDAVIKLINKNSNKCIRYVYIRSGDTFDIKHIPQGLYFLKIAYGNNWKQKVENGKCIGKFMNDALYERGVNELNFYKAYGETEVIGDRTYRNYKLPSYSLTLNVIKTNVDSTFNSNKISEDDFNQ